MRPAVRPDNPIEAAALALNLAPRPVIDSMFGMMVARAVMAGVRLGVFERLARSPASSDELAAELDLSPDGARHLVECLRAAGHLDLDDGRYRLERRARRWLDPRSDLYVGGFVDFNYDQWDLWSRLEEAVHAGRSFEIHEQPPGDPFWDRYIRGQYELARLSGPEVAKALRLPKRPRHLLDAAGAHGWFAAELCRRHPTLQATVVDLPASAAVGRRIIAEAGMADRVRHVEGDLFEADLGGPYDAALVFNLVHHLSPEQNVDLLRRIGAALGPDGVVAVLDLFLPAGDRPADQSAFLGMHFWLASGASTYTPDDLREWLREAGFAAPRRIRIRRIPAQTLYEARRA